MYLEWVTRIQGCEDLPALLFEQKCCNATCLKFRVGSGFSQPVAGGVVCGNFITVFLSNAACEAIRDTGGSVSSVRYGF